MKQLVIRLLTTIGDSAWKVLIGKCIKLIDTIVHITLKMNVLHGQV